MKQVEVPSYPVSIFVAGDPEAAFDICRSFCDEVGLCVTLTQTVYVYTGGAEHGVIVGLINYPRFPSAPADTFARALDLGHLLRRELGQQSFTVQAPDRTLWVSFREDPAQGIEAATAGETVGLDASHESPVAKPCAQNPATTKARPNQ